MATHAFLIEHETRIIRLQLDLDELQEALRIEKGNNGGTIYNQNLDLWRVLHARLEGMRNMCEGLIQELEREFTPHVPCSPCW